jgi:secreted trypsin-like serine protease
MRSLFVVLALIAFSEARPNVDNLIHGGEDAEQGVWTWQLSEQRLTGATWVHNCGAVLLSSTTALTAASCVDGQLASSIRVVAGLYQQSDVSGAQIAGCDSYTMHSGYADGSASYANDIAIIHLASAIQTGGDVELAQLPPDNSDSFAGVNCTITGWGRNSASDTLPDILQQADIGVITTAECVESFVDVTGVEVWDNQVCALDSGIRIGACDGDNGGPLNCPSATGGYYVAGIYSWGVNNVLGNCLQRYPSVFTRTGAYLDWISSNLVTSNH